MFVTRFLCAISLALLPGLCFSQTALKLGHPQPNTSAFQVGAQAFAGTRARVLAVVGGIYGYTVVWQSNIAEQSRDVRAHAKYSKEYFFIC